MDWRNIRPALLEQQAVTAAKANPREVIEALILYRSIRTRFPKNTVLEVCEPHWDNPSPNIMPISFTS